MPDEGPDNPAITNIACIPPGYPPHTPANTLKCAATLRARALRL